jgi:hypothetical protein
MLNSIRPLNVKLSPIFGVQPKAMHTPSRRSISSFSLPLISILLTSACGGVQPEAHAPTMAAPSAPTKAPAAIAQVEADEEEAAPGPSPDEIIQVVRAEDPAMRQCYIVGSFKNTQLAGTVKVTFTIDTDGRVRGVEDAGSNLEDQEVVDCVMDVFAKMEFRAGGVSPTNVTYPVSFGERG